MSGNKVNFRLSEKNVEVVGAEFSSLAATQFFEENNIKYEINELSPNSSLLKSVDEKHKISIFRGDFFEFPNEKFSNFDFIWDRAAMVAINPEDRQKYAKKIWSLLGTRSKSITAASTLQGTHSQRNFFDFQRNL